MPFSLVLHPVSHIDPDLVQTWMEVYGLGEGTEELARVQLSVWMNQELLPFLLHVALSESDEQGMYQGKKLTQEVLEVQAGIHVRTQLERLGRMQRTSGIGNGNVSHVVSSNVSHVASGNVSHVVSSNVSHVVSSNVDAPKRLKMLSDVGATLTPKIEREKRPTSSLLPSLNLASRVYVLEDENCRKRFNTYCSLESDFATCHGFSSTTDGKLDASYVGSHSLAHTASMSLSMFGSAFSSVEDAVSRLYPFHVHVSRRRPDEEWSRKGTCLCACLF